MGRYLCVLCGGAFGSLARYLVTRALVERFPNFNFAVGTFFVNVTGSFAIGVLMTLFAQRLRLPVYWQLTTVVGFLGGYTTFSSFELDTLLAVRGHHHLLALGYVLASVLLGYGAVWCGAALVSNNQ
jgi:fluoride exporter